MYNRGRRYGFRFSFVNNTVLSLLALAFIWQPEKKGTAIRAVEKLTDTLPRAQADFRLRELATSPDEIIEQRGISYVYRLRCGTEYPT